MHSFPPSSNPRAYRGLAVSALCRPPRLGGSLSISQQPAGEGHPSCAGLCHGHGVRRGGRERAASTAGVARCTEIHSTGRGSARTGRGCAVWGARTEGSSAAWDRVVGDDDSAPRSPAHQRDRAGLRPCNGCHGGDAEALPFQHITPNESRGICARVLVSSTTLMPRATRFAAAPSASTCWCHSACEPPTGERPAIEHA
jgi:hypothetical protein